MRNLLVSMTMLALMPGCWLKKPACQVVDIAKEVCTYITYTDANGKKQTVKLTSKEVDGFVKTLKNPKAAIKTCK